jgi:hypothetical protein
VSRTLKIGERAVLIKSTYGVMVGQIFTVTSEPYAHPGCRGELCQLAADPTGEEWDCPVSWLRPIDDDSREKSTLTLTEILSGIRAGTTVKESA